MTFIGVNDEVTKLVAACRWLELLEYADVAATSRDAESDERLVLDSGVVTARLNRSNEFDDAARSVFMAYKRAHQ